jgi:hypothetical protein
MSSQEEEADWEITEQGLFLATRGFLIRRGYCCANQCRNCPYINWRQQATWQPVPAERVQQAHVSPKVLLTAQTMANYYEEQLAQSTNESDVSKSYAQIMLAHYRLLLERWESSNGS